MKGAIHTLIVSIWIVVFAFSSDVPVSAQKGKLNLRVTPKEAYIFVDGRAISEASKHRVLKLSAGDHKIELVNYGYVPANREITVTADQTTELEVTLTPVSSIVSGPFGAMTIETASQDAVLLNGKTPEFFVGHGDEFNPFVSKLRF